MNFPIFDAVFGFLLGALKFLAVVGFVRDLVRPGRDRDVTRVRLGLGRYLVLGLEFQLASDVLSTAVAPTFEEIGQLGAIAAIRTLLNHFLRKEVAEERLEVDGGEATARP